MGGGGGNFSILWEGHSCYEGGHRPHGGSPSPLTREKIARCYIACSMIPISCKFYLIPACWLYSIGSRVAAVSLKQSLVFFT